MSSRPVPRPIIARRRILPLGAVAIALALAGCATPTAGSAPSASPTAGATASIEPTPSPTPPASRAPESTASPEAPTAMTTEQLLEVCLEGATEGSQPAADQISRATVRGSDARSALRPDGLWYVVVPIEDPSVDVPVEYACLLTDELAVDATWGRVTPEVDDFDLWATATEPVEGP